MAEAGESGEALWALAEQVQMLQQKVAEQQLAFQQQLTEQQQMITQQREEVAALQAQVERGNQAGTVTVASAAAAKRGRAAKRTSSRRQLFVTAGVAAAVATAAAVLVEPDNVARAASGDNWVLGSSSNNAAATTYLYPTVAGSVETLLFIDNTNNSGPGGNGMEADGGPNAIGIIGKSTGESSTGVYGSTDTGNGVFGISTAGSGIINGVTSGVYGSANLATGVIGASISGLGGMFSGGLAPIALQPTKTAGPPSEFSYSGGEIAFDVNMTMWVCTTGGTPGTWAKMAQVSPGSTTGGAITYLSNPIRLLDTRPGAADALHTGGGPYTASGSPYSLTIAGASFNGVTIPSGAVGALGNITALGAGAGSGHVAIVPHGAGNHVGTVQYYGSTQTIENSFNVMLAGGQVDLYIVGNPANILLDVWAVVS